MEGEGQGGERERGRGVYITELSDSGHLRVVSDLLTR